MRKHISFVIRFLLFVSSLPVASVMLKEYMHDQKMNRHFGLMNLSEGEPPTSSTYLFHGNEITIEETELGERGYIDAWQNEMIFSDLVFKVNGQEVDHLFAYPVRINEEGLNRYFGEIAYFLVEDKKARETSFVLVLKRTIETTTEKLNGDHVGWVPENELQYTYYVVKHDGEVVRKDFGYEDRNGFETKLLTKGYLAPTAVGYYTNLWHAYPSFFFPFSYPLLTIIIGALLLIFYRPFKGKV